VIAFRIFAANELGMSSTNLILVILMIQFVAFLGALGFGRLARRLGAKNTILVSLVIWSIVVIYAFVGMKSTVSVLGIEQRQLEFWLLPRPGPVGGSQASAAACSPDDPQTRRRVPPPRSERRGTRGWEPSSSGWSISYSACARASFPDPVLPPGADHPAVCQRAER
jgi:hypothetical protein